MNQRLRIYLIMPIVSTSGAIFGFVPAHADCSSEQRSIQAEMQQISAQSGSLGICSAARAMIGLYDRAADFHRRCVPGPAGQSQASEYERAAEQARATASQACN
jgi:hypothetical protein